MRNNERKDGFNKQTCDTRIDLYVKISFRWIEHFNGRKWKQNAKAFLYVISKVEIKKTDRFDIKPNNTKINTYYGYQSFVIYIIIP